MQRPVRLKLMLIWHALLNLCSEHLLVIFQGRKWAALKANRNISKQKWAKIMGQDTELVRTKLTPGISRQWARVWALRFASRSPKKNWAIQKHSCGCYGLLCYFLAEYGSRSRNNNLKQRSEKQLCLKPSNKCTYV